jgi:hypothetical protein
MMSVPMTNLSSEPSAEYREQTWDPAEFADLPTDVQCDIVERACRIQAANDRLNQLLAA